MTKKLLNQRHTVARQVLSLALSSAIMATIFTRLERGATLGQPGDIVVARESGDRGGRAIVLLPLRNGRESVC
jgi:hypothetical protein